MHDRIIKIVIVDDINDIETFYSEIIANRDAFEVRTAIDGGSACRLISEFMPELVIADIDKFTERQEVVDAVRHSNAILVWASRFQTINFEDLPLIARIMNKPFRGMDVKFTIRSELHRADRGAYVKIL